LNVHTSTKNIILDLAHAVATRHSISDAFGILVSSLHEMFSDLERRLCKALCNHPSRFANRYNTSARNALLEILFRSLTNDRADFLQALFPGGFPPSYKLQDAQGIQECAEYTAVAKGHPCGHIFKQGEASYHCMTCTDDNTCVLCSRCFDLSDHEGHQFTISISGGNSGCCDCGDLEAWKRPVNCAIHSLSQQHRETESPSSNLPVDLMTSIRTTIGRVLDYFCDVISCSPENLRIPKTVDSIRHDTDYSRLGSKWYDNGDGFEPEPEYCLILWNDEKHTIQEVEDQVTRACRQKAKFGRVKAQEADDVGRTVIEHSRDLEELIKKANVIEQIKVTVTIRSSRDTFREQMCGTIVEWLNDIAKCAIGGDHHILRHTICEEVLQQWRIGSEAYNAKVGKDGIEDHAGSERERMFVSTLHFVPRRAGRAGRRRRTGPPIDDSDDEGLEQVNVGPADEEAEEEEDDEDDEDEDDPMFRGDNAEDDDDDDDQMEVEEGEGADAPFDGNRDDMDTETDGDYLDIPEATLAGYPPPHPPPGPEQRDAQLTPTESEFEEADFPSEEQTRNYMNVPKTPHPSAKAFSGSQPSHWAMRPLGYSLDRNDVPPYEDLSKNIRLDSMILFDLRLWKQTRIDLRNLYISTVVNVPQFKRILGLRFSGLYTTLSQLYLIADREPDHSIINLSLQMLTSPSITEEVMERGNFLTNLMAILYTFLTTRQVGFPKDVSSTATLAFDAGSVTNRRLYHFLTDLRYFLASEFVQKKVRTEKQYLMQFLDLAKLCQGICPNVRAVGEHVEYETDAWISASLLTREINKLCRQFAESFHEPRGKSVSDPENTLQAICITTYVTIRNSVGIDRNRFKDSEIKERVSFKVLRLDANQSEAWRVVDFVVEKGAISFHHALHYTLSWLLECGKGTPHAVELMRQGAQVFLDRHNNLHLEKRTWEFQNVDDALLVMFDYPLRVCAWLAQMKAGLWVRNGMSLRHQMGQYKGVTQRDVGYHRDLFMLQTALVTCEPSRVLVSMIDRYGLTGWVAGNFQSPPSCEDAQMLDIAEDFVYLLIVLLSDRASLIPEDDGPDPQLIAVRKDIIHTLCFKPLSYSDLTSRLTERAQETQGFQSLLDSMTNFRGPEGLHDSGLFELKPELLAELDPYNANFSKNQRDEAENVYKAWMSKQTNKAPADIVLEPKLRPIETGAYTGLARVTATPLFARVMHSMLRYTVEGDKDAPEIPRTRVEAFLQVVLQLLLIASLEDNSGEDECDMENYHTSPSFIRSALDTRPTSYSHGYVNIVSLLQKISSMDEYAACRPKIKYTLRLFYRKRASEFYQATAHLEFPYGRLDTASPANVENEIEARKKQALERKARVMAQFQQQQQSFMDNQGMIDWGEDDLSDSETAIPATKETNTWKYPSGVCIQCREETNDSRIYGTFAMIIESNLLRQTNATDADWIREVLYSPESLDRSAEDIRPFGVSGENHEQVRRQTSEGEEYVTDRQGLGKGWPSEYVMRGPISSGCGHIMHFTCFENYYNSVARRQQHQIARNHPERIAQKEFVCPLCKALGNAFLPIIWKGVEESHPGALAVDQDFDHFLDVALPLGFQLQRLQTEQEGPLGELNPHREALARFSPSDLTALSSQWQRGTTPISPTRQSWTESAELAGIYNRLRETLDVVKAGLPEDALPLPVRRSALRPYSIPPTNHFEMLLNCLGRTISATEIAYRGQASEQCSTLLSRVPQQTLTHLRILSATAKSYSALDSLTMQPTHLADYFKRAQERQFRQVFVAYAQQEGTGSLPSVPPLLLEDAFNVLSRCSLVLCPALRLDVKHVLHLCYIAEILRVVIVYKRNGGPLLDAVQKGGLPTRLEPTTPTDLHAVEAVVDWIGRNGLHPPESSFLIGKHGATSGEQWHTAALYQIVRSYALPFLRKAIILLNISHGVTFSVPNVADADEPELERLTRLLDLPSVTSIMADFDEYSGKSTMKNLAAGWLQHLLAYSAANIPENDGDWLSTVSDMKLIHPCPLELIGLPKFFDVLMEETHRRKCPTTGKELTDPSICLFCGEIFCSQAVCCMTKDRKRGGCNLHVEK
jgi:E3 ubiquitin-protein ligase UBR1